MNGRIRAAIQNFIKTNGPTDSRAVIEIFANQFSTTKQRISGNVSFMVCKAGTISIIKNNPKSILY